MRKQVETRQAARIALVGATAADVRDVMVEGPSGMLAISPPESRPVYEPSKRRLTWPNGAVATTFSADEPDRLRGPQHDAAWADEIAAWRFPEAWDMLLMGLRIGRARCSITTTARPTDLIRSIRKNPATVETVGTTFENRSNLAPEFFASITAQYEGTRLGRQELNAELLEEQEGALLEAGGHRRATQICSTLATGTLCERCWSTRSSSSLSRASGGMVAATSRCTSPTTADGAAGT